MSPPDMQISLLREVLNRMKVCGNDRMLVTGLGPVGELSHS